MSPPMIFTKITLELESLTPDTSLPTLQRATDTQELPVLAELSNSLNLILKFWRKDWYRVSCFIICLRKILQLMQKNWLKYDFAAAANHDLDFDSSHTIVNNALFSTSDTTIWISSTVFMVSTINQYIAVYQYNICWVCSLTKETGTISNLEPNIRIK